MKEYDNNKHYNANRYDPQWCVYPAYLIFRILSLHLLLTKMTISVMIAIISMRKEIQ